MWLSLVADIINPGPEVSPAADFRALLAGCLPQGYEPGQLLAEAEQLWAGPPAGGRLSSKPRLINVCGLPGSGKTWELDRLEALYPGYFRLAFDQIMENLSGYQQDYRQNRARAFQRWERPARVLGYYVLTRALENRWPVLFEHGNTPPQHLGLYQIIKYRHGYHLEIRWLKSAPEVVRPRLAARPRHFPQEELENRWLEFQRLLPAYRALADEFVELEGWKT